MQHKTPFSATLGFILGYIMTMICSFQYLHKAERYIKYDGIVGKIFRRVTSSTTEMYSRLEESREYKLASEFSGQVTGNNNHFGISTLNWFTTLTFC